MSDNNKNPGRGRESAVGRSGSAGRRPPQGGAKPPGRSAWTGGPRAASPDRARQAAVVNSAESGAASAGGDGRSGAAAAGAKRGGGARPAGGRAGSPREAALDVLVRTEQDRSYSNLLLHQTLQKYKLSRPDAGLATEIVYGTLQRLNTIDYFLEGFVSKGLSKLEPWVRSLLRLSFYQLYYLDRIPDHAVVNEAVSMARRRGHQGISGMVNGVLRNVLRRRSELVLPEGLPAPKRIALSASHPEWLVRRWIAQFGEAAAERLCEANNEPPRVSLRANTRKLSREALVERLRGEGLEAEPSPLAPAGVIVRGGGNMALTQDYAEGLYSIQDESSMLVAEWVDPQPGERVLDCCAAPGGKTTHLAEKMQGRGEIVACDVHEHKHGLIREQAVRLGHESITTLTADARRLREHYAPESFDRILLDAPCSGLGVIRRKPDMKWTKTEAELGEICSIQQELLEAVHGLLKPGGVLVYSTCTVEPAENGEAVRAFLGRHPEFTPDAPPAAARPEGKEAEAVEEASVQIMPYDYGSDGFYIARLRKRA
ncbi:ribosomal RNA small subunit methyltransferase B [Paenibacillus mucilaginosus 3016]|uniref:16S rRNA (cytosine(967)-C(5))-methyltransferase n=1 Tax=Paenibacillus mucilaginosus 3016 TaxID=1116391 RepID=H6NQW4_9BACL|nr:16S rRNA (cytosine(967)-C(5))-methyltransferase RsmB [Paenibacillus mucilaginosus]AFC31957.1 ribosomal RNA small subunit methyltransferase B [Paenibacillus mucilaginosus 3016]